MAIRQGRGKALRSPRQALVDNIMSTIHLEPPWTVNEFRDWLSEELGMSIALRPSAPSVEPLLAGQCGLLAVYETDAVIWYDSSRSNRHQRQQIFHEFAHLMCEHHATHSLDRALREGGHPLVTGLPKELVETMFGPRPDESLTERAEAEAELVGTKLAVLSVEQSTSAKAKRNHSRVLALWGRA